MPDHDEPPILSITQADFHFQATKGTGKGGQARNKTSSAIRCTHPPSGAVGFSQESRSQHENRALAFSRCIRTDEFKGWLKLTVSRVTGVEASIEAAVEKAMADSNLLVEVRDENGRWVPM